MKNGQLFTSNKQDWETPQHWGYRESDYNNSMMAESIKNVDITEIRWKNRQPTDLEQFIKDNEVEENDFAK